VFLLCQLVRMRWLSAVFAALLCFPAAWLPAGNGVGLSPNRPVSQTAVEEEGVGLEGDSAVSPAGLARRSLGRSVHPRRFRARRSGRQPACGASTHPDSREVPRPAFREPRHVVPRYGE